MGCLRKGQPGFPQFIFTFDLLVKESSQSNPFQHKEKMLNLIDDWRWKVAFFGLGLCTEGTYSLALLIFCLLAAAAL